MPQQQGEVSLLTLFADIHYFFGPPTVKPPHHRFDKSSYVYLYHNALQHRGRLEVANYAGTPDQDAFMGYLDSTRIEYSYKHPTLFTITIREQRGFGGSASPSPQQDTSQWHLPAHDLRNEGKYMYPIHTLDIYFWTVDDATLFLDSLKRVLDGDQLRLSDVPTSHSEHRDTMSPVVQKLEKVAITSPYQQRSNSISTTHSTSQSFSGPPSAMTPASTTPAPPAEAPSNYAPVAYNPAAPAAPEPIAHREKTPPPPDAADGTGLSAAAMHEHGSPYGGQLQHQSSYQQQQQYMPGPPQRQTPSSFPPPPSMNGTPPALQRANTAGSFPPPPPPPNTSSATPSQAQPYAQSFAPPPQDLNAHLYGQTPTPSHPGMQRQTSMPPSFTGYAQQQYSTQPTAQYASYPQSPGHAPLQAPLQSPGHPPTPGYAPSAPLHSPGFPPTPGHAPLHSSGLPPPGGYAQYSYGQPQQQQPQSQSDAYAMHQQVYRPTEGEAGAHGKPPAAGPGQQPGRFEQRVDKVEKGVGRFLRKLDKKF